MITRRVKYTVIDRVVRRGTVVLHDGEEGSAVRDKRPERPHMVKPHETLVPVG